MRRVPPSVIDRIAMLKSGIKSAFQVSQQIMLFELLKGDKKIVLKFSYMGNVQYHKLSHDQAIEIKNALEELTGERS